MKGLKTNPKKRVRIRIICPICERKVLKKDLKRHQQGPWCYSQTYKTNTKIPVILGPDFGRKELEKRRLIEHYRENRQEDKRNNDMGNVSHLGYHDGSIAITGGRDDHQTHKVICPICKREVLKKELKRHQKTKSCLEALFKEKETIRS